MHPFLSRQVKYEGNRQSLKRKNTMKNQKVKEPTKSNIEKMADAWLQHNSTLYRGDNASDCMISAFIAGANSVIEYVSTLKQQK